MSGRLAAKRVLIYGGGTGIGFASAEAMAREGARVFLSGRRAGRLGEAAARLGGAPAAGYAPGDATREDDVRRVTRDAVGFLGGLDAVVISAGTSRIASIFDESLDEFRRVCDASLVSTFLASRHAVPPMQAGGGGSIVALSSVLGVVGARQRVAYCAAKAGVIGMVRAMALDLAALKIRANAICPGFIETELSREVLSHEPDPEAALEARRRGNPIGRSGTPAEIAAMAVYLASDEAAYTSGQYFTVDGGYTIR